jgi:bacillolysin
VHERLDQYYRGVRVFGGDVARQSQDGQIISAFGTIYPDIRIDPMPRLEEEDARTLIAQRTGAELRGARPAELVVLPLEPGRYALAWRLRVFTGEDMRQYFVDAATGTVLLEYSDMHTQSAVGRAQGVLGDTKKISVQVDPGGFLANDKLRPPVVVTYDMKGNSSRVINFLNDFIELTGSDIAADTDNQWTDGAVGDAHVYAGWTYDYYFKRFGRHGLDNADVPIRSLVHPARRDQIFSPAPPPPVFFANAAYFGDGIMVYGVGLPPGVTAGGLTFDFMSGALDVVAHELTHGVTDYSSQLIYRNESGALNEAFSDIMGTNAEFFFQPAGNGQLRADYLVGEDVVRPGGLRSMSNPAAYGDPDHYSRRFLGSSDNGGVHINAGIANHAFYLAIEGGTNRTSGLAVQGVGGANREQMEKVFYRAFVQMMPSDATFSIARAVTIQAARDLYGAGSAPERAVSQAWTAVGVE